MHIKSEGNDLGWCIFVKYEQKKIKRKAMDEEVEYVMDLLIYMKSKLNQERKFESESVKSQNGILGLTPVVLHPSNIYNVSQVQLSLPHSINDEELKKYKTTYLTLLN